MSPFVVEQELERERERKLERKLKLKLKLERKLERELKLSGGLMPVPPKCNAYAPSRLSVPSIVAWRTKQTNKQTDRQTRPPSSAGSRPPLPKFSRYVEVDAHYIFHPSTMWVRPHFTELGPKNPPKKPILP